MRGRTPRESAFGFTLFEVMAAVLVLGVVYTVLASTAIQGLRSEGESKRRLEASLLVDQHLAELESGLAAGIFPEIGAEETEQGEFQVGIEVTPFDLTPYLGDPEDPESDSATDSLLTADQPEESLLRLVTVVVRWPEAGGDHEVWRTTLAYDQATIASLFSESEGAGGDSPEDDDLSQFENPDGTPNLDAMMERLEQLTGENP